VPVVIFFLLLAVGFVVDLIVAFFALLVAPYTGIEFLQGLDFWNWFWTAVLVSILISPPVAFHSNN
jgi:hypothetical protein